MKNETKNETEAQEIETIYCDCQKLSKIQVGLCWIGGYLFLEKIWVIDYITTYIKRLAM